MKLHDMWWAPFLQVPLWLRLTLRGNWTPRFPRAWRGRRVTVVTSASLTLDALEMNESVRAEEMAGIRHDRFELKSSPYEFSLMTFYFKDEGVTWVMGWKGKQVDAFKVTVALRAAA